jgi:hypothetical protein
MTVNLDVKLTKHARRRIGQRGITNRFLNALLMHANTEVSVGGGVVALSVTPSRAQNLNIDDKLHRYTALVSDNGALISVIPLHPGHRGRVYRRGAQ